MPNKQKVWLMHHKNHLDVKEFESVKECAEFVNFESSVVSKAVKFGLKLNRTHFAYDFNPNNVNLKQLLTENK